MLAIWIKIISSRIEIYILYEILLCSMHRINWGVYSRRICRMCGVRRLDREWRVRKLYDNHFLYQISCTGSMKNKFKKIPLITSKTLWMDFKINIFAKRTHVKICRNITRKCNRKPWQLINYFYFCCNLYATEPTKS